MKGACRFWPIANIRVCTAHVCFRGQSGHCVDMNVNVEECVSVLMRVHKASTQNQKLCLKTAMISMAQRDKRKSCHSDQTII